MSNSETRQTKKYVRQVDPTVRFDISSTHYTSSCFMQNKVVYFRELAPKQKIDMNVDLYCRTESTFFPLFNHFDLRLSAFFVPYKMIWTKFAEFITQSLRDSTTPIEKVPFIYSHNLWQAVLTWITTYYPQCVTSATTRPTSGGADYVIVDTNGNFNSITLDNQYVRAVFDNLITLGYRPNAFIDLTATNANIQYSALPLLCWTKIWYDFFRVADKYSFPFEPDKFSGSIPIATLSAIINRMAVYPIAFGKSYFAHNETVDAAGNTNLVNGSLSPELTFDDARTIYRSKDKVESNEYSDPITGMHNYPLHQLSGSEVPTSTNPPSSRRGNSPQLRADGYSLDSDQLIDNAQPNPITQRALFQLGRITDYVKRISIAGFSSVKRMLAEYGIQVDDTQVQKTAIFLGDYTMKLNADGVTCTDSSALGAQTCANMNGSGNFHVSYLAKEHGAFLIYLNVRPKVEFVQGRNRFATMHLAPNDFWKPSFDGYGYQGIRLDELNVERNPYETATTFSDANGSTIMGVIPVYAEYKVGQSCVSGEFSRWSAHNTYDAYHTARIFRTQSNMPITSDMLLTRVTGEVLPDRCWSNTVHDIFLYHIDFNAYIDAPMRPLFDLPGDWESSGPTGHMNGDEVSHM